jgi:hypothetical protein
MQRTVRHRVAVVVVGKVKLLHHQGVRKRIRYSPVAAAAVEEA